MTSSSISRWCCGLVGSKQLRKANAHARGSWSSLLSLKNKSRSSTMKTSAWKERPLVALLSITAMQGDFASFMWNVDSPCNRNVGRTLLTHLLHICLNILNEPLKKHIERCKIPEGTVLISWEKLLRVTADLSWTLVRTHRPQLVCWCGWKHLKRRRPPCCCRPGLSASKCGSSAEAAHQTLHSSTGTAPSAQWKSENN